jgi:phosphoribosyl 1,2-cyclic phosphate phosphodiesterase
MKVTVLGCGGSTGVPAIGPDWGRCDPADRRNRRRRVSVLVEIGNTSILIDTSPDLREQLLDAGVRRLDAVVVTHAHADHLHGIDDLRSVNRLMQRPIPLYADAETLAEIRRRFGYALESIREPGRYHKPTLVPHEIIGPFEIQGIPIVPFAQDHGFSTTLGLRIGGFAYSTDVTQLDDAAFAMIEGIELWIVDCLRREPHPTHSHLERTLSWIARVRPRCAVLTHMDQSMDYRELSAELPSGVEPGCDGLVLEIPDPCRTILHMVSSEGGSGCFVQTYGPTLTGLR